MTQPKVDVFFYGSYMNFNVLKEVDLVLDQWEVARLNGFDIKIEPRANLVYSNQHCVYGIVSRATHQELARLYSHAENVLGEIYLPQAVIVETLDNKHRPALCYICHNMVSRQANKDYVKRIVLPAKEFLFPQWYIERLESFYSNSTES
ncbi:MAG: gamma-glutamylcyclotransferase [Acidobacteria bacterium]|nr:gamma-glutamylcyclotransferase [Acidobacteriota bacterium]